MMTGQDVIEMRMQITTMRRQIDGMEASLDMLLPEALSSVAKVLRETAAVFDVTVADLVSNRRPAHLVLPRQAAYWVATETTALSLPVIGQHIGGRDHTTVPAGRNKAAYRRAANTAYRDATDAIVARVRKVDAHA